MARTHAVYMSCPQCGDEIEVELEVSGRHIRATRDSPEEWPEIVPLSDIACPSGCVLSQDEIEIIDARAVERASEDIAEAIHEDEDDEDEGDWYDCDPLDED